MTSPALGEPVTLTSLFIILILANILIRIEYSMYILYDQLL